MATYNRLDYRTVLPQLEKSLNDKIDTISVDYIVEQGEDDIWTYRKWASGVAECWGEKEINVATQNAWGSGYVSATQNITFPSGIFSEAPIIHATNRAYINSAFVVVTSGTNNTIVYYQLFRPASTASQKYIVTFYAIGKWK